MLGILLQRNFHYMSETLVQVHKNVKESDFSVFEFKSLGGMNKKGLRL